MHGPKTKGVNYMNMIIDFDQNVKLHLFKIKERLNLFSEAFTEDYTLVDSTKSTDKNHKNITIPIIHPDAEKAAIGILVCAAFSIISVATYLVWDKLL